MRLAQKYLRDVHVFTRQTIESGYVGTETKWVYHNTIKCDVQPAESKITAQIYGDKVYDMYSVICPLGAIGNDHKISFASRDKAEYKVVSVKNYLDHTVVLAEVDNEV